METGPACSRGARSILGSPCGQLRQFRWGVRLTLLATAMAACGQSPTSQTVPNGQFIPLKGDSTRLEAEAMRVVRTERASVHTQDMTSWGAGRWSGDKQLFVSSRDGAHVELTFDVAGGEYLLMLEATRAPDYGVVRFALDGIPLNEPFDGYARNVTPVSIMSSGSRSLEVGEHRLTLDVAGKSEESSGYFAGLDALTLIDIGKLKTLRLERAAPEPQPASRPSVLEFPELNFRLRVPRKPWIQTDAKKFNPDATVALMRTNPTMSFTVLAEAIGDEAKLSSTQLAEIAQARLKSVATDAQFRKEGVETVNGIEGVRFLAEARIGGRHFCSSHWVAATNGYAYQLVLSGQQADAARIEKDAPDLCRLLERIDSDRVHRGNSSVENVEAPQFGYRFRRKDSGWVDWTGLREEFPDAHSGAVLSSIGAAAIVPLRLEGHIPTLDELATALLASLEFDYPSRDVPTPRPTEQGGCDGYAFELSREVEGMPYAYRLRVLKDDRHAYLLAAWCAAPSEERLKKLEEILARVEFPREAAGPIELLEGERKTQGRIFTRLAVAAWKTKQFGKALAYSKTAFALDSTELSLISLVNGHAAMGQHEQALALLDKHLPQYPGSEELHAARADQLASLDRRSEAAEAYARLFADGFRDDERFEKYVLALVELERLEQAHAALDERIRREPSKSAKLLKADVLRREKRYDEALALLQELQEEAPFNAVLAYKLAENYLLAGKEIQGHAVCEQLIARGLDTAYAYYLRGECEMRLRRFPEAKASFERALQKAPADAEVKRALEAVSALLGRGDNRLLQESIEPVPPPPSVKDALRVSRQAAVPLAAPDCEAAYLSRVTGIEFDAEHPRRRTEYGVIRILTDAGVKRFNTLVFDFDPLTERVYVNSLTVYDAEGNVLGSGDLNAYYVIDDRREDQATFNKLAHLPVPGLQAGCTLDYAVTTCRMAPSDRWDYETHVLSTDLPVEYAALFVRGDVEHLKAAPSGGVDVVSEPHLKCWTVRDPPRYYREPLRAPLETFLTVVALCDQRDSWQPLGTEYLESIREQLKLGEVTRNLSERLTQDLTEPRAIIAALAAHVQSEYSYTAIEFGRRARVPNLAAKTIQNRFGDCKDHALLLCQLLRARAIPAHLALARLGGPLRPDFPSLDQFDHMVVYAPELEGGRLVDCTSKNADPLAPSLFLADNHVLVLDPAGPHLAYVPPYPAELAEMRSTREVELADGRDAVISETLTLSGALAEFFRGSLRNLSAQEQCDAVQTYLARYGVLRIDDVQMDAARDFEKPLVLRLRYRMHNAFQPARDQLVGRLPAFWERSFFEVTPVADRKSLFELRMPMRCTTRVKLSTPKGYRRVSPESLKRESHTPFLEWNLSDSHDGGELILELSAQRLPGRWEAARYSEFQDASAELLDALEVGAVFEKLE